MAQGVVDAVIRVGADVKSAVGPLNQLQKVVGGIITTYAIKQIVDFTKKIALMADEGNRVGGAFNKLTASIKVDADTFVSEMKRATAGMIEQTDLQKMAVKGMVKGFSADEIVSMMNLAKNYALSTGEEVSQVINEMFSGSARTTGMALKRMGITVNDEYGKIIINTKEIKKRTDELMSGIGGDENSLTVQTARLNAQWKEQLEILGGKILPIVIKITQLLNGTLGERNALASISHQIETTEKQIKAFGEEQAPEGFFLSVFDRMVMGDEKQRKTSQTAWDKYRKEQLGKLTSALTTMKTEKDKLEKELGISSPITIGGGRVTQGMTDEEKEARKKRAKALRDAEEKESKEAMDIFIEIEKSKSDALQRESDRRTAIREKEDDDWKEQGKKNIDFMTDVEKRTSDLLRETDEKQTQNQKDKLEQRKQNWMDFYGSVAGVTGSLISLSDAYASKEMRNLDKQRLSKRKYDNEVKRIENEAQERQKTYARLEQALLLGKAIMYGAQAIQASFKAGTEKGGYIGGAIEAALAAIQASIQIAVIQAQKFARGTRYAPGGMSIVGEQGPEMVMLPRGSQVRTATETQSILNNNQKYEYHFHGMATEQIVDIERNSKRRNRTGTLI